MAGELPAAVFSDVDGTLLDGDHRVSPRTAAAARFLSEQGVPLVLVSARMPEALVAIRRALGNEGPVVCYGGAYVLDGKGSELLSRTIGLGCVLEVRDFVACDVPDVCCMAYGYHSWVVSERSDPRVDAADAVAFGDGQNDVDMFCAVGESWAMANAPAEVRAAAARVTWLDNVHDGLAEAIFSLIGEA